MDQKELDAIVDKATAAQYADMKQQKVRTEQAEDFFNKCKRSELLLKGVIGLLSKIEDNMKIKLLMVNESKKELLGSDINTLQYFHTAMCSFCESGVRFRLREMFIFSTDPFVRYMFDKLLEFTNNFYDE
jgi:hypothetical protein